MKRIYTGIDLGSDSVKIVVSEFVDGKFYVLASATVPSIGIKKGIVVDSEMAINSVNLAVKEIHNVLGIKIKQAIVVVPSNDRTLNVVSSKVEINGKNNIVDGTDIKRVLQESTINVIPNGEELVSVIPISFSVDNRADIKDPKGEKGDYLEAKAVCATAPKKIIYDIVKVFSECGIEVLDIVFGGIGDYYEAKASDTANSLGAIINIGSETIDISIFNKGIIIKNGIINLGSRNIDKDITYVYGVDLATAKELKEKFAVCSRRYADINDSIEAPLTNSEKVIINQYEITEIVEARVIELLKLAKKEINDLTKRKISYIIVTGGISDLTGFSYVVENTLGITASTLNMTTIGIRSNRYSSAFGSIKYFYEKNVLRGNDLSMLDKETENTMMTSKKSMIEAMDNTIISKLFGYFTND